MSERVKKLVYPKDLKLSFGDVFEIELKNGGLALVIPMSNFKNLNGEDLAKIQSEIEAKEILSEAESLTEKRLKDGWTRKDFKKDMIKVKQEIEDFLSSKQDEN